MEKSSACFPLEGKSNNLSHVPTLVHVKEPSSCSSLRVAGKIRMYSFLPSLIEVSRAAWCGVPLEMKEGTIPIWGTKGLSTRPRCITLMTTQGLQIHIICQAVEAECFMDCLTLAGGTDRLSRNAGTQLPFYAV
jgi:hypothetical protein